MGRFGTGIVMPGLDPGIQGGGASQFLDYRIKSGNDELVGL